MTWFTGRLISSLTFRVKPSAFLPDQRQRGQVLRYELKRLVTAIGGSLLAQEIRSHSTDQIAHRQVALEMQVAVGYQYGAILGTFHQGMVHQCHGSGYRGILADVGVLLDRDV